jgi:hypothetical protein
MKPWIGADGRRSAVPGTEPLATAAPQIIVKFDPTGVVNFQRALDVFGTTKLATILHYALDQVGNRCNTQVRKELVKQTSVPRHEIDRLLRVIKSGPSRLIYTIEGISHHEALSRSWFRPTQEEGGVSAQPWNQPRTFPGTFIEKLGLIGKVFGGAEGQSGGWVFKRTSEGRRLLWGPSVADEMERGPAGAAFKGYGEQLLPLAIEKKLGQFMP